MYCPKKKNFLELFSVGSALASVPLAVLFIVGPDFRAAGPAAVPSYSPPSGGPELLENQNHSNNHSNGKA